MIKRLIYVHFGNLNSGQANIVHVARMADAFSGVVDRVILITLFKGHFSKETFFEKFGRRRKYGLRVTHLRGRVLLDIVGLWLLTFWSTRFGTSGVIYTRSTIMAVALAVIPLPMILEMHVPFSSLNPHLKSMLFYLVRLKRFRSVVVISGRLKDIVGNELSLAGIHRKPNIVVAHDGANPCLTNAVISDAPRRLKVGYAGHLYPGRGIDLIVECARQCPSLDFEVVGGTPSAVEKWMRVAASVSNIVFSGSVSPVLVEKFLLSCDVLIAPYAAKIYVEGGIFEISEWISPMKIFEYMAAGRAIVCSRISVIQEVLEDDVNCVLCPPGKAGEWVAALERVARDPVLRERLGERARADLLEKYTWDVRAKAILGSSGF